MNEDGKAIPVEHEPGQERAEHRGRKFNLVHRAQVGSDQLVVPASELRVRKICRHAVAQTRRALACGRGIVIDMGVIMADARGIRGESFLPSGDIHREAPEYAFLKAELPKW